MLPIILKKQLVMWYNVNISLLGRYLLPPMFRSAFIIAFVNVLLEPIKVVCSLFVNFATDTDKKMNITVNVATLEAVLNDACGTTGIYFETPEPRAYLTLYTKKEGQYSKYFGKKTEGKKVYLYQFNEIFSQENFVAKVPSIGITSVDEANKATVETILNKYKPIGKSFRIELYSI